MKLLTILLAFLISFSLSAKNYDIIFEKMIIHYDEETSHILIQNIGYDKGLKICIGSMQVIGGFEYSGPLSEDGISINGTYITPDFLKQQRAEQLKFLDENHLRYNINTIIGAINEMPIFINKILLVMANMDPRDGVTITHHEFLEFISALGGSGRLIPLILGKTKLSSDDDLISVIQFILKKNLEDPYIVAIARIIRTQYPEINFEYKLSLYTEISSDPYRIDCIRWLYSNPISIAFIDKMMRSISADPYKVKALEIFNSQITGTDMVDLAKVISSDVYKVSAIKLMRGLSSANALYLVRWVIADNYKVKAIEHLVGSVALTSSDSLSMLYSFSSDPYKINAIKLLRNSLTNISSDQYFKLIDSFSSSYQREAIKYLPRPTQQPIATVTVEQPQITTNSIESETSSIQATIEELKSLDWDTNRLQMLTTYKLNDLTPEDVASILRTFKWDKGKTEALRIIVSRLTPIARVAINKNVKVILNTFVRDKGKVEARSIL